MLFEKGKHDDPSQLRGRTIRFTVLTLFLLTVLGVGGIYLYGKLLPGQSVPSMAQQEISSPTPTTIPTSTPMQTTVPTPAPELSLMMVGDDLLHLPVSNSGRQPDGSYNYNHLFKHIRKDVKRADLSMINQEVLLAGSQYGISGYPCFNGRYEVGDAIVKAGFRLVLHATNHSMDRGAAGVKSCLERWEKKHPKVIVTGMYNSQKDQNRITCYKKNGICVAILNYTYGTNGIPLPSDMPYAVNLLTRERVKKDVKKARKKADFIIVCPHWGTEYNTGIDAMQKEWTKYFLKLGVDLVIGTHPHVIEPVQWKKDKKGHRMLVYYSLGNYINSTVNRGTGVGKQFCSGMAKVTLQRQENGSVEISTAKFVPLITHWPADGKLTTYKLSDYNKKLYGQSRVANCDAAFTYDEIKRFFRETISNRFLEQ